jgi:hypothetical protein
MLADESTLLVSLDASAPWRLVLSKLPRILPGSVLFQIKMEIRVILMVLRLANHREFDFIPYLSEAFGMAVIRIA